MCVAPIHALVMPCVEARGQLAGVNSLPPSCEAARLGFNTPSRLTTPEIFLSILSPKGCACLLWWVVSWKQHIDGFRCLVQSTSLCLCLGCSWDWEHWSYERCVLIPAILLILFPSSLYCVNTILVCFIIFPPELCGPLQSEGFYRASFRELAQCSWIPLCYFLKIYSFIYSI